jgi:hypothetical protein
VTNTQEERKITPDQSALATRSQKCSSRRTIEVFHRGFSRLWVKRKTLSVIQTMNEILGGRTVSDLLNRSL